MKQRIVIVGAGGQARELAWVLRESLGFAHVGYVVTSLESVSPYDSRDEILGDYSWLRINRSAFDAFALGIGTPPARLRVAETLRSEFPEVAWPTLVHPRAIIDHATVKIGDGVLVAAGAVVTVGVTLERFCMVNFAATIGHEAIVGEGSVINPGANVSGGVRIGRRVLIGTGAQILQYRTVGDGATVGAGAVVTRDIVAGTTVTGVPAKDSSGPPQEKA